MILTQKSLKCRRADPQVNQSQLNLSDHMCNPHLHLCTSPNCHLVKGDKCLCHNIDIITCVDFARKFSFRFTVRKTNLDSPTLLQEVETRHIMSSLSYE